MRVHFSPFRGAPPGDGLPYDVERSYHANPLAGDVTQGLSERLFAVRNCFTRSLELLLNDCAQPLRGECPLVLRLGADYLRCSRSYCPDYPPRVFVIHASQDVCKRRDLQVFEDIDRGRDTVWVVAPVQDHQRILRDDIKPARPSRGEHSASDLVIRDSNPPTFELLNDRDGSGRVLTLAAAVLVGTGVFMVVAKWLGIEMLSLFLGRERRAPKSFAEGNL